MSISTEINRVKYISEDFSTYRQEADEFFSTHYPSQFNNLINTDLGNAVMDQLAFAMMAISFSVNRKASELFLATARLNSSITKLSRMLGYPISSAFPASLDLKFNISNGPFAFPITIQKGFQFKGPGDVIYEYREDADFIINAGSVSGTIPAKEGKSRTVTFVASGLENQEYQIVGIPDGEHLYADGLSVVVDGAEWTKLDLLKYESTNTYEVLFTESPPKLRFGDGIVGNIPQANSQVILRYAFGKGLQGSVGSNQITGVVTPLIVNGQQINFTFTNSTGNVGGDPEDIRHVKAFASSFFRTQNAAVIKSDYDTIAQLENGVAIADAQVMRGVSGDITIQMNFQDLFSGKANMEAAAALMLAATVSGIENLGVSGIPLLYVGGTDQLGVSGLSSLGVSGIDFLGWNGSFVTGVDYLGVSGVNQLSVSGVPQLYVGGDQYLGVSGVDSLGISQSDQISYLVSVGGSQIDAGVSGLYYYLSQAFSDTSKANAVQVVVLSVDINNKYVAPTNTLLSAVQSRLADIADAVVTVKAVDGSSKIVEVDAEIDLGISPTAIENDVIQKTAKALYGTVSPYGILVRRKVGQNLYLSDIVKSVQDANTTGDVIFVSPTITNNLDKLDTDGNLIIERQQVIQNRNILVKVVKRFRREEVF